MMQTIIMLFPIWIIGALLFGAIFAFYISDTYSLAMSDGQTIALWFFMTALWPLVLVMNVFSGAVIFARLWIKGLRR